VRALDPGCGTGELLAAVARRQPSAKLHGWDIDPTALAAAAELVPAAMLEERSALEAEDHQRFDLVIANPPYFQLRVTPELKARFGEVISGRANVFALFFKVGLDLLRPGGTLAYIVPPSMNSGAYFEALREHIVSRARIAELTVLEGSDLFEGANTAAQLLVLEKHGPAAADVPAPDARDETQFVFERSERSAGFRRVLFAEHADQLGREFTERSTLWQLGYEAVTGTVVWNQRREDLQAEPGPDTVPLIFSRDLHGGTIDPGTRPDPGRASSVRAGPDKPRHIVSEHRLAGPALLVNRVVGAVGRGELRTAFVPKGVEFLAENHVNVVRPRSDRAAPGEPGLDWHRLQAALEEPGTAGRIRLLTGNTQLSATELTHLVPLSSSL
jgi:adenine-specific DNA-methyltransferase